ncbi:MAG TPA: glycosyltransferase family 4 protein, partial [Gemmatimonadaceae bacterium]|nr:glycosyltransferase family 4 protein [Gemmatimonadaceae bacterium]
GVHVTVTTGTAGAGTRVYPFAVERCCPAERLQMLVRDTDVVHLQTFHGGLLLAARRAGKKIVATYRDLSPICPKGTKWKQTGPCLHPASITVCVPCLKAAQQPVARRLCRPPGKAALSLLMDANVCTGAFSLRRFPLRRLRMIPNGVDTDFFVPRRGSEGGGVCTIVFVGRLIPEKGGDLLLHAASLCAARGHAFRVSICGEGPDLPRLRAIVDSSGLEDVVAFHGTLEGQALPQAMQRAEIAVVPSRWDEPFGLTAVEAMSCGLAVVAADVGGLGPIVNEAGLTFPREDAAALASHIERLIADPALRRELGRAGRALAIRKYDWRRMGGAYLRLYRELIGTGPQHPSRSSSAFISPG